MDVMDTPSQVVVKGKPLTRWIKNKDAKMIIILLIKTGMAVESDIKLVCDKNRQLDKTD